MKPSTDDSSKAGLSDIVQRDVKSLIDHFKETNGQLRGDRKASNQNNTSNEPILWGQSIRPTFPVSTYTEFYVNHALLANKVDLEQSSQTAQDQEEVSYHSDGEEIVKEVSVNDYEDIVPAFET